jgi:lysozyme
MTNDALKKYQTQIKRHEGLRLVSYRDTLGYWTIGYGHLLGRSPEYKGIRITQEKADELFSEDFGDARRIADCYLELSDITRSDSESDNARYAVIVNMAFNLGYKLDEFITLRKAILAQDWQKAADAMLASRWAKQVGVRAIELARQMRTGEWQEGVTK